MPMKRFMKKVVAAAAAATLVLSMSLCAFAAPSPGTDLKDYVGGGKNEQGETVEITTGTPTEEERPSENIIQDIAGSDYTSVGSTKIEIPQEEGTINVDFTVPGGVPGETYTLLIPDGDSYTTVTLTADADGKVVIPMTTSGVVTLLSKAAVTPDPKPGDTTDPDKKPTTGGTTTTKPSTSTTTTGTTTTASKTVNSSSTSPKTGESSMVVLASALAVAATAGACVLARRKRA